MRLYNRDHQAAIVEQDEPGVRPGESYDFTDEQIAAGISGVWSKGEPRKASRGSSKDKSASDDPGATGTEPVETGEKE